MHAFRPATPVTPSRSRHGAKRSDASSLHFSTSDENVDAAEFHRIAAQMLCGEIPQADFLESVVDDDSKAIRQRDMGFSIATSHPCLICDFVCTSEDQLHRHITSRHDNHMEICPECGDLFTAEFLPTHLARGFGGCEGMMQASYASSIPQVDDAYMTDDYFTSASQRYWIYDGDHSWSRGSYLGSCFEDDDDEEEQEQVSPVEQTVAHVKSVLRRPISEVSTESCNICGDSFSTGSREFAQHMGHHTQDFAQKQHRCDECQIFFANEADLERHLQSAELNQHCGFTFRHNEESCTGHHRPTHFMASTADDHSLMQKHLWAWERCQFQTNRLSLARVLKQRGEKVAVSAPASPQVCEEVFGPFVPHFTAAGREDSFHWSQDEDVEVSEIDAHFSRIISQVVDANVVTIEAESKCRPDSLILIPTEVEEPAEERTSYVDLTALRIAFAQLKNGHKRNAFSGSLPLEFLRKAAQEADRPPSMPTIHTAQAMPLIRLGA